MADCALFGKSYKICYYQCCLWLCLRINLWWHWDLLGRSFLRGVVPVGFCVSYWIFSTCRCRSLWVQTGVRYMLQTSICELVQRYQFTCSSKMHVGSCWLVLPVCHQFVLRKSMKPFCATVIVVWLGVSSLVLTGSCLVWGSVQGVHGLLYCLSFLSFGSARKIVCLYFFLKSFAVVGAYRSLLFQPLLVFVELLTSDRIASEVSCFLYYIIIFTREAILVILCDLRQNWV